MLLRYSSAIFLLVQCSYGANILAILPTPSYGHQIAFTNLWKELSLRGHQVTVATSDPLHDPQLTNLTEIDMKWTYKFFTQISKLAEDIMTTWNFQDVVRGFQRDISSAYCSHKPIQDLISDKSNKFDLVLTEFLFPEFLAIAEIHKCPKIIFGSLDVYSVFHNAMGNSINPILYPEIGLPFHMANNFAERLISTMCTWKSFYMNTYKIFADKDENIRKYFNISAKTYDLVHDTDLLIINSNPLINNIRATGPTTINIGDLRRYLPVKPLSIDLKDFLDNATDGFIYFSLGSNVKSKEINKNSLNSIKQALGQMPHKVLWKFEADHLAGKPPNVKIVKWTSQPAVLAHPNIKLFVTQGGLQSIEEGIYNEVPFVVIPFFADQYQNARLMKIKGVAKIVERVPYIEEISLKEAMTEVITNQSYKNSVRKLKQLALDTPMTGLEKGIWWIEYVIRNKGAKHLKNPAVDLPFYQYYLIDVITFLFTIAIVIFTILFVVLRIIILRLIKIMAVKNVTEKHKKLQ